MKRSLFIRPTLTAALLLVGTLPLTAAPKGTKGVEEFDPQAFPGKVVDDVIVPVPSEVFSVLDKLGEPNWQAELRKQDMPTTSDRTKLSLLFGYTVAEGFVAVQAQDKEAVKDIGHDVISLSKSLGLSKSVLPHAQAILDAADKGNWSAIRREFDLTQKTVRDTMENMKDVDLSQCVSLGGWLRGTASVTSVVKKSFSADRAELLNQPMLVEHFLGSISKMPASTREHDLVRSVQKGLASVLQNMEGAVDGFTKDAVSDIGKTCDGLLSEILAKK
ncbi:hypothetical protein [Prosthecobacter sp.]|uniref:hypothetical protein n=1 Tax=Prosthecobacter sp. TaxID=1965333 RepID=UPI003784C1BB